VKSQRRGEVYCLDADALINIHIHYPKALRKLRKCAKDGNVVIVEGVHREIRRKSDKLKAMVDSYKNEYDAVKRLGSPPHRMELVRLENAYGDSIRIGKQSRQGFRASASGRKSADSQVVTACKVDNYICVSNDRAIQDACHLENVPCIGWQEFYRRMEQGFTGQKRFF
jgi:rRNA-processing protein FCF1